MGAYAATRSAPGRNSGRANPLNLSIYMQLWLKLDQDYDGICGRDFSLHGHHLLGAPADYSQGYSRWDGNSHLYAPASYQLGPIIFDPFDRLWAYTSAGVISTTATTVADASSGIPIGSGNSNFNIDQCFILEGMPTATQNKTMMFTSHTVAPTAALITCQSFVPTASESGGAGAVTITGIRPYTTVMICDMKIPALTQTGMFIDERNGAPANSFTMRGLFSAGNGFFNIANRGDTGAAFNSQVGANAFFDDTPRRIIAVRQPLTNFGNSVRVCYSWWSDGVRILADSQFTSDSRAQRTKAGGATTDLFTVFGQGIPGSSANRLIGRVRNLQVYRIPQLTFDNFIDNGTAVMSSRLQTLQNNGIWTAADLGQ